jgi:DNA-binding NarL/FixJ family response regulator
VVRGASGAGSVEAADDGTDDGGLPTWERLPGASSVAKPSLIRVLLADDQALVRAGFRSLLETEDGITVVGEADDGLAAIGEIRRTRPDVVLMDIRMPGMSGLEATRRIKVDPLLASARILMLTTFELDEYVFEALRAGASGFLVKHTEPAELVRAVRVVAAGDALLSPSVTRRLIAEFASRPARVEARPGAFDALTEREREVVTLVAAGLSNDEIAAELVVSPATARTHVSRAMVKVHARDRAQLVVFAYRVGLVAQRAT